ncbi:N-formylglutamate amidohydrolase [Noviherbaspirillum aerium]|uniref:N-formylglutamate amidohydrolase n=1 Tax=Noviherbaspirillum aerium TaxID=2588497 RepID=UPI00124F507F|nr:N-formylglutamate amidohydrolase [Noviherbaspirillum aerium]
MSRPDFLFITCEHGGNRIPARYRHLFADHEALLHTHRGYDAGALRMARDMSRALSAPLAASTVSRLLIDLNRSPGHPRLYSEATRPATSDMREEIFRRHYLPYRSRVEADIAQAVDGGARVIHVSCHSFTPELDGDVRNADIGLLYDPSRAAEVELCRRWRSALRVRTGLRIRMNYPYSGTSDGFTVHLRRRFPAGSYLGIELEINQKHVSARSSDRRWREMRRAIIEALAEALRPQDAASRFPAAPGMSGTPATPGRAASLPR